MSKTVKPALQDIEELDPLELTPVQAGAIVAGAARLGNPEQEAIARRNLAEAKIADAIKKALDKAPKLTPTQVQRLSRLLSEGGQR